MPWVGSKASNSESINIPKEPMRSTLSRRKPSFRWSLDQLQHDEAHCCWLGKQLDDKERGVTRKRINCRNNWAAISARSRTGRRPKMRLNMPPFLLQPIFGTLDAEIKYFSTIFLKSNSNLWYFYLRSGSRVNARFSNAWIINLKWKILIFNAMPTDLSFWTIDPASEA